MRQIPLTLVVLVLAVLAFPPAARAQAYFAPFIGFNFGGDAGDCPSVIGAGCSRDKTTYGFSAGALKRGIVGGEFDFSYSPRFFGEAPELGGNNVLTFMGNVLLAVPAGPVRAYVTGGFGLIRSNVERFLDLSNFSENSFAYNLGAGLMVVLPAHLGVRVDVRRMSTTGDVSLAGQALLTNGPKLSFSRASFALVLH
jgi:opacity protein-like surface antigen